MPATTLVRAARGFNYASHSFRAITPILYRTLFYPSAPPPSQGSTYGATFPSEARDHLSEAQFSSVRSSGGFQSPSNEMWGGILPDRKTAAILRGSTPEELWQQNSNILSNTQRVPARIYKGRTVFVKGGDVGKAYLTLQAILRNNNVRMELRLAERHEKKGAKRRRLRSERWRRKFADEVRKKVKLVSEIRLRDRMWGARH